MFVGDRTTSSTSLAAVVRELLCICGRVSLWLVVMQAAVMLVLNGQMVATVWAESIPYWSTASNVAVLKLDTGHQVWLLLLNRASHLHGYMYTTFSGTILFTL